MVSLNINYHLSFYRFGVIIIFLSIYFSSEKGFFSHFNFKDNNPSLWLLLLLFPVLYNYAFILELPPSSFSVSKHS